jgi:hypothetical protein
MLEPKLTSPKLRVKDDFFPFYAGFSKEFVAALIDDHSGLGLVVDPWNGSGTTTTVAAMRGSYAAGYDINPAMTVVAKANLATEADVSKAWRLCNPLFRDPVAISPLDPLRKWFTPKTASFIRHLSDAIRNGRPVTALPYHRALVMVALFNVCRSHTRVLSTSNPTWRRLPLKNNSHSIYLTPSRIFADLQTELSRLASIIESRLLRRTNRPYIAVADVSCLPLRGASVGLVIGSPPYCTRIDYAVATAIELAALAPFSPEQLRRLRERSMGTTAVTREVFTDRAQWGRECTTLLRNIHAHPSKASRSYYYKTHIAYFYQLTHALAELRRIVSKRGSVALVVQDSYYKDIHNDLPKIVIEMAEIRGLNLTFRTDFQVKRTIAIVNQGARVYRRDPHATESVLIFTPG